MVKEVADYTNTTFFEIIEHRSAIEISGIVTIMHYQAQYNKK